MTRPEISQARERIEDSLAHLSAAYAMGRQLRADASAEFQARIGKALLALGDARVELALARLDLVAREVAA